MPNFVRTAYRITGGQIDTDAIATGSSNTSGNTSGQLSVAHGMSTTPSIAIPVEYSVPVSSMTGPHVRLIAVDATNASFVLASSIGQDTAVPASSFSLHFVWAAIA